MEQFIKSRGNYTELNWATPDKKVFEEIRILVKTSGGSWTDDPTRPHGGYWYINTNNLLSIRPKLENLGLDLGELKEGNHTTKISKKFDMSWSSTASGDFVEVRHLTDSTFHTLMKDNRVFSVSTHRDVGPKESCFRMVAYPDRGHVLVEILRAAQKMGLDITIHDQEKIEKTFGIDLSVFTVLKAG